MMPPLRIRAARGFTLIESSREAAQSPRRRGSSGFTLIELSIVLVIIALIVGSGLSMGRSAIEAAMVAATNKRMDAIEAALMAYRMANNRLPCPADLTLTESSANFGVEAANKGTCTGGTPAANFDASPFGANVSIAEGAVPVRALNLPDSFAYDGYGNKIAYGVWANATGASAFFSYGVAQNCGNITVNNSGGGARTSSGLYSLISFGKNRHGAYSAAGAKISSGSVNANEQTNCHCDASAVDSGYAATYVQMDATANPSNSLDSFDDIVRYKERWQMATMGDSYAINGNLTCPGLGFRVDGVSNGDKSGSSVATGDVNGDGIADLIIGAPDANSYNGVVYVVFGTRAGFPIPLPLASLDGTNGFKLNGENNLEQAGHSVASGDINGDGIADIIVGAPDDRWRRGSHAYVVFGKRSAWSASTDLSSLDGTTTGLRLNAEGISGNTAGRSVTAGDVNGDGIADIIIGAPGVSNFTGAVYVVFGHNGVWPSSIALSSLDGTTTGFKLNGENNLEQAGHSVASGDINGDGKADVIIGAPAFSNFKGVVYVVFGKSSAWSTPINLSSINGTNGFKIIGENNNDYAGLRLASGDVNGDGIADVISGSYLGPSLSFKGVVYVVFGKTAPQSTPMYLSSLTGENGFRLNGETNSDEAGYSVASGDINGDGIADIIVGAPQVSAIGSVYVVFGKRSGWSADANLSTVDGTTGFKLNSENYFGGAGASVASGDINSDGKADVIVGANTALLGGNKGYTYVYLGQKQSSWANPYNLGDLCPNC